MAASSSSLLLPAARLGLVASGAVAFGTSYICFRDMADFSHWVHKPDRNKVMQNISRRHEITAAYLGSTAANLGIYFGVPNVLDRPTKAATATSTRMAKYALAGFHVMTGTFWFLGYINPVIMMRGRAQNALYVSTKDAERFMKPEETLIVAEVPRLRQRHGQGQGQDGTTTETKTVTAKESIYAFTDNQIVRPHIANLGTTDRGEPAYFCYCGLSGGGIAFELPDKVIVDDSTTGQKTTNPRDPIPYIQLENNLVVYDRANDEWGHQLHTFNQTELLAAMATSGVGGDDEEAAADYESVTRHRPTCAEFERYNIKPWHEIPTFRMTWENFARAYPDCEHVFINDYREFPNLKRPLLTMYDKMIRLIFEVVIGFNKYSPMPVFPKTIDRDIDPRLYLKTRVWGFNVGDEYACVTEEFVKWDGLRNFKLNGVPLVAAWDAQYECLNIFKRPNDEPIQNPVNVYGQEIIIKKSSSSSSGGKGGKGKDKDGKEEEVIVLQTLERLNTVKPGFLLGYVTIVKYTNLGPLFWRTWPHFSLYRAHPGFSLAI